MALSRRHVPPWSCIVQVGVLRGGCSARTPCTACKQLRAGGRRSGENIACGCACRWSLDKPSATHPAHRLNATSRPPYLYASDSTRRAPGVRWTSEPDNFSSFFSSWRILAARAPKRVHTSVHARGDRHSIYLRRALAQEASKLTHAPVDSHTKTPPRALFCLKINLRITTWAWRAPEHVSLCLARHTKAWPRPRARSGGSARPRICAAGQRAKSCHVHRIIMDGYDAVARALRRGCFQKRRHRQVMNTAGVLVVILPVHVTCTTAGVASVRCPAPHWLQRAITKAMGPRQRMQEC